MGNLTLPGWGGEFELEVSSSKYLLLGGAYQLHVLVSEHHFCMAYGKGANKALKCL